MIHIAPKLYYVYRHEWRPDESLPRLGGPEHPRPPGAEPYSFVPPEWRVALIIHHTTAIDPDPTPNVWETWQEVFAQMRRLQTVRPDLGYDVPYNDVGMLMPHGVLAVCEGRGHRRSGAHTAGFLPGGSTVKELWNIGGIALAIHANLDDYAVDLEPYIKPISQYAGWLKYGRPPAAGLPLPNLGTVAPAGQRVWGHKQAPAQTVCPGQHMMARIHQIRFTPPNEEEQQMRLVATTNPYRVYAYDGLRVAWILNAEKLKVFRDTGMWPAEIEPLDQVQQYLLGGLPVDQDLEAKFL